MQIIDSIVQFIMNLGRSYISSNHDNYPWTNIWDQVF